ncbi:unnamed protein product [Cunninghamella echinulata]
MRLGFQNAQLLFKYGLNSFFKSFTQLHHITLQGISYALFSWHSRVEEIKERDSNDMLPTKPIWLDLSHLYVDYLSMIDFVVTAWNHISFAGKTILDKIMVYETLSNKTYTIFPQDESSSSNEITDLQEDRFTNYYPFTLHITSKYIDECLFYLK